MGVWDRPVLAASDESLPEPRLAGVNGVLFGGFWRHFGMAMSGWSLPLSSMPSGVPGFASSMVSHTASWAAEPNIVPFGPDETMRGPDTVRGGWCTSHRSYQR